MFRQLADGTGVPERLTKAESGVAHIPQSWSPDTLHLLYTERRGDKYSLRQLALADRRSSSFAAVESETLAEASFSPDGKWVAYSTREERGTAQSTYVVPFPPTGAKYVVPVPRAGGGHAFWFPKGDALHLNVGPGEGAVVSVRTRPQFGFGPPESYQRAQFENNPATTRRNADALPDGRILGIPSQFLVGATAQGETPRINVALNWTEELKQRVRTR